MTEAELRNEQAQVVRAQDAEIRRLRKALEKIAAVSMTGGHVATKLDEIRAVARHALQTNT